MLQTKLQRSFVPTSKKFNRRARVSFDVVRNNFGKIILVAVAVPLLILLYSLFIIHKVNCTLNGQPCPKETQTVFNKLLGTNSLFVNQKELLTFIKAVYPVDTISVSYKAFNTLNVNLKGNSPFVPANVYLVNILPVLSMDTAPSTTDSASWWVPPTGEIETFISSKEVLGFDLWNNGSMTTTASPEGKINYIFSEKPTPETIRSIYNLYGLVTKYLDVSKIYIVNNRVFLSLSNGPVIIIGVPFDEGSLVSALQSISYLSTIKKDAKVIDLSFKNPIIR